MSTGFAGAVCDVGCIADTGRTVGVVAAKITAVKSQKTLHHMVTPHYRTDAAAIIHIPGTGTVGIPDADVFFGKDSKGFFPADAGKFTFSTFAGPFHRPAQTVFT